MGYKICFVLENYFKYCKGGAELQAERIAHEFHNRGWEVHYVYIMDSRSDVDLSIEDDNGIILHKIRKRAFWRRFGRYFFLDFFQLHRILRKIDPDIVYQRGRSAYTGMTARYANTFHKKYVWAVSSATDCKKNWLSFSCHNPIRVIINTIDNWFAVYGLKRADIIITQANYQTYLLEKNFGVRSVVIPNSHYVPGSSPVKKRPTIVAWIANIKELKRPELFIDLAKACQDLDAQFILAGRRGRNKYQNMLIANINRTPNVKYIGEISFQETNELLASASILVSTSLPVEGFPNTFIQAWLQKTPVVSLNNDPDNVLEKEGIGFHSKSFERMVKDVKFLLKNKDELKRIGEKARIYAEANFDINNNIIKMEDLFLKLLRKGFTRC